MKRRRTDWYCQRCRRPLRGSAECPDTVTPRPTLANEKQRYVHDQCGGEVTPGKDKAA